MEQLSDRPYCPIDTTVEPKSSGFMGGAVGSAFLSAFL